MTSENPGDKNNVRPPCILPPPQEYQGKLERVTVVREELKSHLANLPDFSKLPMGSATSLAPLPTVGDLFN